MKEVALKRLDLKNKKFQANSNIKNPNSTFYKSVTTPKGDVGIIAEIKLASPSAGRFVKKIDVAQRVKIYEEAGADAISIVTDKTYFGGNVDFVQQAKKVKALPILQKDFVIDTVQIEEARAIGSDALLLIARILEKNQLDQFVSICQKYGIEPVVEVYDAKDLEKVVSCRARIIAVNARDLDTFEVDIKRACDLARFIPDNKTLLGFSGIETAADVTMYKEAGASAVLVGGMLMRSEDVEQSISQIKGL